VAPGESDGAGEGDAVALGDGVAGAATGPTRGRDAGVGALAGSGDPVLTGTATSQTFGLRIAPIDATTIEVGAGNAVLPGTGFTRTTSEPVEQPTLGVLEGGELLPPQSVSKATTASGASQRTKRVGTANISSCLGKD
jgi:hypothetical protein